MRSHAKAATAGSNSGWGARRGSSRRSGTLAGLIVALIATACLLPGASLAAETRPLVESFGPDGTSGTSFGFPHALAFDQGNEQLYALDQAAAEIHGFDASTPGTHTPLGGNFPLTAEGSEPFVFDDLAVDSSSHNIFFVSEVRGFSAQPAFFGFDSSGAPLGGNFPVGGFGDPCGAAVDPSGNVWVSDYATKAVVQYDAAGNLTGSSINTSAEGGFSGPCRVAFDSAANLYVSFYEGGVWKYTAASGYTSASEVDPEPGVYPTASAPVAVDRTTDNVYVAHSSHISVYDSSGAFLYEFGGGVAAPAFYGIAVSEANGEVYVSDASNAKVHVFGPPVPLPDVSTEDAEGVTTTTATLHGSVNPEGEQLTDCHFEYGTTNSYGESADCVPAVASIPADSSKHAVSADISGLSAGTTYHFRLVAGTAEGTANGADRVLTTPIGPPTVSAQSVEAVGTSDVTLSAKINPKGAKTTYHVEYGTTASYGQSTAESAPIGFANDDSDHTVKVHIGGLSPGTAYHFRFVATSAAGTGEGTDTAFATHPAPPGVGACPNDAFRTGFGARLPDCRAYEQATPTDKHGANTQGTVSAIQASSAGDRVTFYLGGGLPTSGGSSVLSAYVASRGPGGWGSDGLLPATDPGFKAALGGWSEDLSASVGTAERPGGTDLYLRDGATGKHQLVVPGIGSYATPRGFAADPQHLVFEAEADLLPGTPSFKRKLYDLDHGGLTLVGRVPASGTSCDDVNGPACTIAAEDTYAGGERSGTFSGSYYTPNAISRDGSKAFFSTGGQLYVREDGTRTTRVSASQATVPDPNGQKPATFMGATPDGSKAFFLSCERLTDDSTAVSTAADTCVGNTQNPDFTRSPDQGRDLYSYDTDTGELTDLTVDANVGDERRAGVQGVLGASDDGSYVYFVANGVLAAGASAGNCLYEGFLSLQGECNLYVTHNGTTRFIARLDARNDNEGDFRVWGGGGASNEERFSRVSADGGALLFGSVQSLTGYPNDGKRQLYRYTAADEGLACVSCNPVGTPPSDGAALGTSRVIFFNTPSLPFLTRNLSADGNRSFFESSDALLPSDTNGVTDVYEWEAKGSGSCKSETQNGGCLYLLSSGTSPDPSYFADASRDGDHVFFLTSQRLVPSDRDELTDIYDAGVGAGLAAQHTLAPATCTGTACQANPPPPPDPTMASAAFQGPGNAKKRPAARKCPKGKRKVRRAGKVRCQKTGKKASKKHKRHSNRGGSK